MRRVAAHPRVSHIRPGLIWLYSAVCLVNINAIKPALIGYRANAMVVLSRVYTTRLIRIKTQRSRLALEKKIKCRNYRGRASRMKTEKWFSFSAMIRGVLRGDFAFLRSEFRKIDGANDTPERLSNQMRLKRIRMQQNKHVGKDFSCAFRFRKDLECSVYCSALRVCNSFCVFSYVQRTRRANR